MKAISKLVLLTVLTCACTSQGNHNLTGEISGLSNDTILVIKSDPLTRKSLGIDTIAVKENRFALNTPDSSLISLYIIEKPKGNGAIRMSSNPPFILLPGEKMRISGHIDNLTASGTEIYDNINKATDITEKENEIRNLSNLISEAYREKDSKRTDSLKVIYKESSVQLSSLKLNYIKNNPNSILSGYLFLSLKSSDGTEAEKLLGENIKNGPLGELISKTAANYRKFTAIERASENIKPGKPAPDFKLKNLNGEEMTLASFNGKYTLLDFWGTWCGWCIKGMPDMKKYYAKYKNKMEIVGICCRDTENKWREGVENLQLPWTNLYNGNDDEIVINYAVTGYPTKILIDPQGKIVEVFVGESEELYKKLDMLFK
ncbi:AhpC/TSA family protein [uncultured Bacteroides sp.]|uniref:AhpC/TSA family protein n=1 Tax=uncultured Bacteroides sp. TaxID=162156 RepID=UPI0025DD965A|nr:AhpC/TSA family protein [uncultured Bacteroides sp.]